MMHYVYLENAHDISFYSPFMNFQGDSVSELIDELYTRLKISDKAKVRFEVYDRRHGCTIRKRLLSTIPEDVMDVYVMLK